MFKRLSKKRKIAILNIALSTLVIGSIGVSTFAYWSAPNASTNATFPTNKYNATDDEFDYYAAIPNVFAADGYDYYNLNTIPNDLVCRVTGLAVVRYEALTSTAYIPSYPKVTIGGTKFNDGTNQLPVIHILGGMTSNDTPISSGYTKIKSLVIPSTVTYIQQKAFDGCSFKDVSVLSDGKAGCLNYTSGEFGSVTPVFEPNRDKTNYTISTTNANLVTQFSDKRLEYDNLTNKYYTYVVNKSTSDITVTVDSKTAKITAGAKYKLEYDKTSLTATAYSYKLAYDSKEVPLFLNTKQTGYEEYKIDTKYSVFSTANYQTVSVNEYIGGNLNKLSKATFNLKCLDANYSQDNDNFEFKYAPNNIFESTHYYNITGSDELKSIKVQKRIGIEKAYFLNNVSDELKLINNDKILTISVPYKEDYKNGLYVKAQCGTSSSDLYIDPETKETIIPMKLENGVFTYSFTQSVIDSDGSDGTTTLPDASKMTFYAGKEQVTYPDNYKNNSTDATNPNKEYRRIYFNPYSSSSTLNLSSDYNVTTDEYRYHWYVVGWDKDGHETSYKMAFLDNQRKAWIVDVPNSVQRFKLARMEGEKPLDTSNNWSKITNQSRCDIAGHSNTNGDYVFTTESYVYLDFKSWNNNEFYVSVSPNASSLKSSVEFRNGNNNYLTLSNCKGSTKFVPLKENIFYGYKNIASSMFEFSTYDDNVITSIPVPAGTVLSAFANKVTCGYDQNKISIGFAGSSEKITGADLSKYIKQSTNGIEFISDCMIVPYIKTTGTSGYEWYIEIQSSELDGITSENVVDTSKTLSITPTIKSTNIGNTGSVNSPDFVPSKMKYIYLNYNNKGNNHFLAFFWNKDTNDNAWVNFEDNSNSAGQYMCEISDSVKGINPTHVIFVLKSNTNQDWNGKISQTGNIPFSLMQAESCIDYNKYLTASGMYVYGTMNEWKDNDDWRLWSIENNNYIISSYFTAEQQWKLHQNSTWYGYNKINSEKGRDLVNNIEGTDNNISFKEDGCYTIYFNSNNGEDSKISIVKGCEYWYEPFVIEVKDGSNVQTVQLKRGTDTMQGNAMQFYGTGLNLTANSEIRFKYNNKYFDIGTDSNKTNLVYKENNTQYVLHSKGVASDVTVFLKSFYKDDKGVFTGGFDTWFQDAKSPILKVKGAPELLIRNLANTAFEEFISLNTTVGNKYVVSPYYSYDANVAASENYYYFGNGSNLHYYGDKATSENKLGYHAITGTGRLFTFKPNSINGTEEYIIVKDNKGHYLATLNYSEAESLSTGVHTFDGLIPYVKDEYTNIKLYYKNGGTEDELVYGGSGELKPEYLSQTLSSSKPTYEYDYYMDDKDNPYQAFVLDNGSYYMEAVTFGENNTKHVIRDKNGNALNVNNRPYADYQINGFNLFDHETNLTEFKVGSAGCYDILVYIIDSKNCYVGYRGANASESTIKLRILDNTDKVVAEYEMNQTTKNLENRSLYLYDAFIKTGHKAQVVNSAGVVLNNIAFDSLNYNKYNRIIYSARTNEATYVSIDTVAIHFTPGGLNKYRPIYDTSEIVYRYDPDPFRLRLADTTYSTVTPASTLTDTSKKALIQDMSYDPSTNTYCWNLVSKVANDVIKIGDKTCTIKEPGNYKLTYSNGTLSAIKLQKPDTYYISLDNKIIAELNVKNSATASFYEYTIDTVIFNNDVNLTSQDLNVVDANGYLVSEINKVTISGQSTSSTSITKGAYTLNYSVDSARRSGSAYYVFTYFKLTAKSNATVEVTFNSSSGVTVKIQKQAVDKILGTPLLPASEVLNLDANTEFLGWSTSSNSNVVAYKDQAVVSTALQLYPVIHKVHEAVILTDLTFDSLNSEVVVSITGAKSISSVTCTGAESADITNYISTSNNLITIQNELFEKIGYVASGHKFTVTFLDENSKSCSLTFTIDKYPNFGETVY